jgi:hypothetical protein
MLFPPRVLEAIVDGRVDLAFRRWERPRVRAGGQQRTAVGVIGFEAVELVDRADLTAEDARRGGYGSLDELLAFVDRRRSGSTYRIRVRLVGADPRVALRESLPDDDQLQDIQRRLARLDQASHHGAWTRSTLEVIRDRPGVPAAELAAAFGREKRPFKFDVRKLKELGLTESLRPGYRLSPRGRAVVERLAPGGESASAPKRGVEAGVDR